MKYSLTAAFLLAMSTLVGCAAEAGAPEDGTGETNDDSTVSSEVVASEDGRDSVLRRIAQGSGDSHVEVMAGPQPQPWIESGPQPQPWTPPHHDPDPRGDNPPPDGNGLR